jgi:hypothetical protein
VSLQVPWLIVFGAVTLIPQTVVCFYMFLAAYVGALSAVALSAQSMLLMTVLFPQDLKPFDQALQMVMVICIFLEFILTIRTVSASVLEHRAPWCPFMQNVEGSVSNVCHASSPCVQRCCMLSATYGCYNTPFG